VLAVEAQDVGQHGPEGTAQQVALLAEDGRQVAAGPFQIGVFQADREGHFGFDALDAEQREHGDQVGIGFLVEDQEAGIDRMRLPSSVTSTVLVWPPR
jgi:hypothetical protein